MKWKKKQQKEKFSLLGEKYESHEMNEKKSIHMLHIYIHKKHNALLLRRPPIYRQYVYKMNRRNGRKEEKKHNESSRSVMIK